MSKLWLLPILATGAAFAGTVLPSTEAEPVLTVYELDRLEVGEAEVALRSLYAAPEGQPRPLSARTVNGQLVVRATPAVQDQVRDLLERIDR